MTNNQLGMNGENTIPAVSLTNGTAASRRAIIDVSKIRDRILAILTSPCGKGPG
jgi:hypothetical protein